MGKKHSESLAMGACFIACTLFGISYMFCKMLLESVDQWVLLANRFGIAFIAINLLILFRMGHISLKGKPLGMLTLMALAEPVIYFSGECVGITLTGAAITAVMSTLTPVVAMVLSAVLLKEPPSAKQLFFGALSVVGTIVVVVIGQTIGSVNLWGVLIMTIAIFGVASNVALNRMLSNSCTAFERTYFMFFIGFIFFITAALIKNDGNFLAIITPWYTPGQAWMLLYLGLFATTATFLLTNYALSILTLARETIFSAWTVVTAVLTNIFILGEPFNLTQGVGCFISLLGVLGVNYFVPEKKAGSNNQ